MFHFPYVFTFFVSPFIRKYSRQLSFRDFRILIPKIFAFKFELYGL